MPACELAAARRMSVGSLYRHYGSKQGLALAVREYTESDLTWEAYLAFSAHHGEAGEAFAPAFFALFERLVRYAVEQPDLFGFTFLHWHAHEYGPHSPVAVTPVSAGALMPPQSSGGATRAYLREVLETGEKEGALRPGSALVGEGPVWGTLLELARAARQGARVGPGEARASAEVLWRTLARAEDSGPRGAGTPSPCSSDSTVPTLGVPEEGGCSADPTAPMVGVPRAAAPLKRLSAASALFTSALARWSSGFAPTCDFSHALTFSPGLSTGREPHSGGPVSGPPPPFCFSPHPQQAFYSPDASELSDFRVDLGRRWDLWVHVLTQAWLPLGDVWLGLTRIAVRGELDMRQTGGQGSPARWTTPRMGKVVDLALRSLDESLLERILVAADTSGIHVYKYGPGNFERALPMLGEDLAAMKRLYMEAANLKLGMLVILD